MEPYGTPACIHLGVDISPSTETLNFHCKRNELMSLIILFHFYFLGCVFVLLVNVKKVYSVFNTCHFIKSLNHYMFRPELAISGVKSDKC
jgi:hypothetical protein